MRCLILVALTMAIFSALAGQVRVRSQDQAFDAFAVRDAAAKAWQTQQTLRERQQLQGLQSLPLGCLVLKQGIFLCNGVVIRRVNWRGASIFIRLDPLPLVQSKE